MAFLDPDIAKIVDISRIQIWVSIEEEEKSMYYIVLIETLMLKFPVLCNFWAEKGGILNVHWGPSGESSVCRHGILRERVSIARGRFVSNCGRICGIH